VPAKANHSKLMETYSQTLCSGVDRKVGDEKIVDDTTKMRPGQRAREVTSVRETD